MRLSDSTLARKCWLDLACTALQDYRGPGHIITDAERSGLAAYMDRNLSPADAAELYQAVTG